jgi:hypothetical protein
MTKQPDMQADADPILALIAAAGLRGFKSGEKDAAVNQPAAQTDPVVALIQAAGLRGFKRGEEAVGSDQPAAVETDPVLEIIAAAGLPGFRQRPRVQPAGSEEAAPAPKAITPSLMPPQAASLVKRPLVPISAVKASAPSATRRRDVRQWALLEIGAGGEKALASLEAAMGMPFAANADGQPYWSEAKLPDGGVQRAFSFLNSERRPIEQICADLGKFGLTMSISAIKIADFASSGPGACERSRAMEPPQLPPHVIQAVNRAISPK